MSVSKAFADELEKLARRKKEKGPSAGAAAAIGLGGNIAAGVGAQASGLLDDPRAGGKDEAAFSELVERAKKKGIDVDRETFIGPAQADKGQKVFGKKLEKSKIYAPTGKTSLDALAHEYGHARGKGVGRKLLRKLYPVGRVAHMGSLAGVPAAALYAGQKGGSKKEQAERQTKAMKATGVMTGAQAPMLAEEARATIRGGRRVYKMRGLKRIPKYLGRTGLAFGTYAAPSVAGLYAMKKFHGKRKALKAEMAAKRRMRRKAS